MSEPVFVSVVSALGVVIAAMLARLNSRLTMIHIEMNSRLDQLLKAERAEADAAGEARGRAAERQDGE